MVIFVLRSYLAEIVLDRYTNNCDIVSFHINTTIGYFIIINIVMILLRAAVLASSTKLRAMRPAASVPIVGFNCTTRSSRAFSICDASSRRSVDVSVMSAPVVGRG
jgi:hypothetical protein